MREASHGVRVKPTSKLVSVEVMTTMENCLSMSATKTCRNKIGRNTTTSTRVMDKAAKPISIRPSMAAARFSLPMSRWRWMFSSTTVASSTSTPMMSDMANKVIRLRV